MTLSRITKRWISLVLLVLVYFSHFTFVAQAAALPAENFDSYSAGVSLAGDAGGSGFSSNWANSVGTATTDTAPAGGQGGIAAHFTGSGNVRSNRSFTANTLLVGTMTFMMYTSDVSPSDFDGVILDDNLDDRVYVKFASANIQYFDGSGAGYQNYGSASANTWYTVTVEVDSVGQPNKFRIKVGSGAFSAWTTAGGGVLGALQTFKMDHSASASYDLYVDAINTPVTPSTTPEEEFPFIMFI